MSSAARPLVLSLVCMCVAAPSAAATTWQVTSAADDGSTGTLRYALSNAATGDTIDFPSPGLTIKLTSALQVTSGVDIEGCSAAPNATTACATIAASGAFDGIDVDAAGAGATIRGLAITGAGVGINVNASNVTIGGPSPATEDIITGSAGPAILVTGPATGVDVEGNVGEGNAGPFIDLQSGANGGPPAPMIVSASSTAVTGLAPPGALVRLYASHSPGSIDGVAGTATADQSGMWVVPGAAVAGEELAATEAGQAGTSGLSQIATAVSGAGAPPPTTTIGGASGTVSTATPAFTLGASDANATVLCRVDSAPYQSCGTAFAPSALSEGSHTLYARAAGAGGLGPEVSDPFTVNLAKPGKVTAGPPRFGRYPNVVFRFSVPAGTATTGCAIDDGQYAPCASRFTAENLLDGRHVFHLRTTDAGGQPAVLDTVFTIDTLAPRVSLASARVRIGSGGAATFHVLCPPSEPGGCSGSLRIGTLPARKSHRFREIGAASWQAGPNVAAAIPVRVPRWAVALAVHGAGGLAIEVVVTARDDAGNVTVLRRRGGLRPPGSSTGGGRP